MSRFFVTDGFPDSCVPFSSYRFLNLMSISTDVDCGVEKISPEFYVASSQDMPWLHIGEHNPIDRFKKLELGDPGWARRWVSDRFQIRANFGGTPIQASVEKAG
jgi:hypothetical protein